MPLNLMSDSIQSTNGFIEKSKLFIILDEEDGQN
jgi:hypothetical protein